MHLLCSVYKLFLRLMIIYYGNIENIYTYIHTYRLLIYTHLKTLICKLASNTHLFFTKKLISQIHLNFKWKVSFATN